MMSDMMSRVVPMAASVIERDRRPIIEHRSWVLSERHANRSDVPGSFQDSAMRRVADLRDSIGVSACDQQIITLPLEPAISLRP